MSLGIGFGAFAEGMAGGYSMASNIDAAKKNKKDKDGAVKEADNTASKITGEVSTKVGENIENKTQNIGMGISQGITDKINANLGGALGSQQSQQVAQQPMQGMQQPAQSLTGTKELKGWKNLSQTLANLGGL